MDLAQGGSSGFADAAGFTGYAGKWRVNSGATLRGIRNGGTAWGTNTAADAITLNGGTLAVGGIQGAVGNWTWNTPTALAASTTSAIDEQNIAGTGRYLKLNSPIAGSGNLTFKASLLGASTFTDLNTGFLLTGDNTVSGTVTIGGPAENGIVGRLSTLRGLGGIRGATATDLSTTAGTDGTLGTASIVNNGWLTFAWTDSHSLSSLISGSGSLRFGSANLPGTENQVVTFVGTKTYTGDTLINRGTLALDAQERSRTPRISSFSLRRALPPRWMSPLFQASRSTPGKNLIGAASGGSSAVSGNLAAGSGTAIVPGGSNAVGTLTFYNNLNLNGGTTVLIDANNTPANDSIQIFGELQPDRDHHPPDIVAPPLGLVGGTYTLFQVSGNLNGSTNNFALAGLASVGRGQTFSLVYDTLNKQVNLVVTGSPGTLVWRGDGITNTWTTPLPPTG